MVLWTRKKAHTYSTPLTVFCYAAGQPKVEGAPLTLGSSQSSSLFRKSRKVGKGLHFFIAYYVPGYGLVTLQLLSYLNLRINIYLI